MHKSTILFLSEEMVTDRRNLQKSKILPIFFTTSIPFHSQNSDSISRMTFVCSSKENNILKTMKKTASYSELESLFNLFF